MPEDGAHNKHVCTIYAKTTHVVCYQNANQFHAQHMRIIYNIMHLAIEVLIKIHACDHETHAQVHSHMLNCALICTQSIHSSLSNTHNL